MPVHRDAHGRFAGGGGGGGAKSKTAGRQRTLGNQFMARISRGKATIKRGKSKRVKSFAGGKSFRKLSATKAFVAHHAKAKTLRHRAVKHAKGAFGGKASNATRLRHAKAIAPTNRRAAKSSTRADRFKGRRKNTRFR